MYFFIACMCRFHPHEDPANRIMPTAATKNKFKRWWTQCSEIMTATVMDLLVGMSSKRCPITFQLLMLSLCWTRTGKKEQTKCNLSFKQKLFQTQTLSTKIFNKKTPFRIRTEDNISKENKAIFWRSLNKNEARV